MLLHELGRAWGFRLGAGKGKRRIVAGSGRALLRTAGFTLRLVPMGGYFIPRDAGEPRTKRGRLLMLAGGPLVSLLAALFGALRAAPASSCGPAHALTRAAAFAFFGNLFQFLSTATGSYAGAWRATACNSFARCGARRKRAKPALARRFRV